MRPKTHPLVHRVRNVLGKAVGSPRCRTAALALAAAVWLEPPVKQGTTLKTIAVAKMGGEPAKHPRQVRATANPPAAALA